MSDSFPARDGHLVKAGGRLRYKVKVEGCDDVTTITVDLDDVEAAVVGRIAGLITDASEYGCMPKMLIHPASATQEATA